MCACFHSSSLCHSTPEGQRTACGSQSYFPPHTSERPNIIVHQVWQPMPLPTKPSSQPKFYAVALLVCVCLCCLVTVGVISKKSLPDPTSESLYYSFVFCYCFVLKTLGKCSTTKLHPQTLKVPRLNLPFCNYWPITSFTVQPTVCIFHLQP